MKNIFLTIFTILLALQLSAKGDGVISGRLFDNSTIEPLPFARVTLNAGEKMVTGTVSGDDGRFTIDGIEEGEYSVVCTFVGYIPAEIPLLVGKLNSVFDLGRTFLNQEVRCSMPCETCRG
jgi:hypothetical protein